MRCKKVKMNLEALIDGDLNQEVEHELVNHLDSCKSCREFYEDRLSLKDKLVTLMEDSTRDLILPAVESKTLRPKPAKVKFMYPYRRIAYVAGLFLIIAVGFFLYQRAYRESLMEKSRQILPGQSKSSIQFTATVLGDDKEWIYKKIYFKRYNGDEHSMELTIKKTN